jgi:hypothetical protein
MTTIPNAPAAVNERLADADAYRDALAADWKLDCSEAHRHHVCTRDCTDRNLDALRDAIGDARYLAAKALDEEFQADEFDARQIGGDL